MACHICQAPVNGLNLCAQHVAELETELRDLAGKAVGQDGRKLDSLVAELETTHSRQARLSSGGPRAQSAETPLPYHPTASSVANTLRGTLLLAISTLASQRQIDKPVETASTAEIADWLYLHIGDIAKVEAAGDLWRSLTSSTARPRRIIDRPPSRRYVGPCDECGRDLYVPAVRHGGHDTVRCQTPGCGAEYPMEQRRVYLLEQAYDRLLTAAEMSRAIRNLLPGDRLSIDPPLIRKWAQRGRLTKYLPHPKDERKRPRYRVEEVIHLARAEADSAAQTPT